MVCQLDGEKVTFCITHQGIDSEETEVPLTDVTLADGVATLENFEFPYAGVYTITCTLPESNKYDDERRVLYPEMFV